MNGKVVQDETYRDFPGGPVVKTLPSNAETEGLIPGQGTKILQALWPKKKKKKYQKHKKQKQCYNKFNKDF